MMRSVSAHSQRLDVGIGDDEIDPLQPRPDHVVHGVSARTAHPKHRNPRLQLPQIGTLLVDAHVCLFDARASRFGGLDQVRLTGRSTYPASCPNGTSNELLETLDWERPHSAS
jgi:hypothetical protein